MNFVRLKISDVVLIEPDIYKDDRGHFFESYREDLFKKNGIYASFVQDNYSLSKKGVLRGLHFQMAPASQAKLVRVVRGEVFDVVVDLRKQSKTYGQFVTCHLNSIDKKSLFIPEGFAHGFLTLSDEAEFVYKTSTYYSPSHERGLLWNDPSVGIVWPKLDVPYHIAERDKQFPLLKDL